MPYSPVEVRSLWAQLRRDEPHLLANFEEFLARVTLQLKEANQERQEMESALKRSGGQVFLADNAPIMRQTGLLFLASEVDLI